MQRYGNLQGDSGVRRYDAGEGYLDVEFAGGDVYRYSNRRPGPAHLHEMLRLAQAGRGLSTYISRYVRDRYEKKLR